MKHVLTAFVAFVLVAGASAQTPPIVEALDGLDPVILVQQGKEVFGKADLAVERGRFRYLFSSADTKAAFEREPARYEIQLGGACARMGGTATGNPADYYVHDGRIYVFGSDECRKRFAAAPEKYLLTPATPMPSSAEAATNGRALLDRLAAAIGGANRLDALSTYAEIASQVQRRADREVTITTRTIWQFPSRARIERTMPNMEGGQTTFATVLTNDDAWSAMERRTFPVAEAARPTLEQAFGRHPLAILKARTEPGFQAAALERATIEGTAVQRVRVRHRGLDAMVALGEKSGLLHSIEFRDRNMEGELGQYTILYSDFRDAGGLMLPRTVRALFNGQPDAFQSWTVQSAEVNPPIDAGLFQKPEGTR
jgi:YHS domain-containing protein